MADFDRAALRAELIRDEGLVLFAYDDSSGRRLGPGASLTGHATVGVGRCLDTRGLDRDEAMLLLDNDITRIAGELDRALPWWRGRDPVRQRVLLNMAFNLGTEGLCGFHAMLDAVRDGDFAAAADAMQDSRWAH